MDFLDRLRQKPEGYRMRVTLLLAIFVTGFIVVVWLATFEFSDTSARPVSDEPSPFETLRSGFRDVFESGTEQFEELRENTPLPERSSGRGTTSASTDRAGTTGTTSATSTTSENLSN